jgi:hypothetical protein
MRSSEEYALVMMAGDSHPQILPTRGRGIEELEAFCATFGAAVLEVYPSMQEAIEAAKETDEDWPGG